MSALLGTLRATLRLRGALFFWCFYLVLLALSAVLLRFADPDKAGVAVAFVLAFAGWMGWLLFLSRLWQLQQHAESLQLPGARRSVEAATVLLAVVGTGLPALLFLALDASPGWALLTQWLALSSALVYLMVTPTVGVILLVLISVVPMFAAPYLREVLPGPEALFYGLWAVVVVLLAVGQRRWRRLMHAAAIRGWNVPQVIAMAERGSAGGRSPSASSDPTAHWVSRQHARLPADAGPQRPLLALSVLLCGPMAPLGWRNYLAGSAWMLIAIGFLAALAFSADPTRSGPGHGLSILLGVWALAVPLTLISRLRQLWRDDGDGLAEAALLPGVSLPGGSWWQLTRMLLLTTGYRLALPVVLICGLLVFRANDGWAAVFPLAVALWSLLLACALLPLARRSSALSGFLLYAGMTLVLIGVIAALIGAPDHGVSLLWKLLLPLSLPVLLLALAGWACPPRGRPLVQP